jgi:hypothetical protein
VHGEEPQRGCDACEEWATGVQEGAYFAGGYGPDTETINAAEALLGLHDGSWAAAHDAAAAAEVDAVYGAGSDGEYPYLTQGENLKDYYAAWDEHDGPSA